LIEILKNIKNQEMQLKISGHINEDLYLTLWSSQASMLDSKHAKSALRLPFVGASLSDDQKDFKLSITVPANIKTIHIPLEFKQVSSKIKFRYLLKVTFDHQKSRAEALPVLDTAGRQFCNSNFLTLGLTSVMSDQRQSTKPLQSNINIGSTTLTNLSMQGTYSLSPNRFINVSALIYSYESLINANFAINQKLLNVNYQLMTTRPEWLWQSHWGRTQWGWIAETQYNEFPLVIPLGFNQLTYLQQESLAFGLGLFAKFFSQRHGLALLSTASYFPLITQLGLASLNGQGYEVELSLHKSLGRHHGAQVHFKKNNWQKNYLQQGQSGRIDLNENTLIGLRYLFLF
jgi:hypothetical protein